MRHCTCMQKISTKCFEDIGDFLTDYQYWLFFLQRTCAYSLSILTIEEAESYSFASEEDWDITSFCYLSSIHIHSG